MPAHATLPGHSERNAETIREGRWARMLRWIEDRHRLLEKDDRLLLDLGLTRGDVLRGVPFRTTSVLVDGI